MRIGAIPFLNCRPYYDAFRRGAVEAPGEIRWGVPTEINRGLVDDSIDVGPISTVAWARSRDLFDVVEGFAIASAGPVRSILLASDRPWEAQDGETIACDTASETSVALLAVLSRRSHRRPVRTVPAGPDAERGLLIGDRALRLAARPDRPTHLIDLGALWHAAIGLPMTYAVWVVRRDARARDAAAIEAAVAAHREALAWGEARLAEIAAEGARDLGIAEAEARAYLEALAAARRHPRRAEGIDRFLREAERITLAL